MTGTQSEVSSSPDRGTIARSNGQTQEGQRQSQHIAQLDGSPVWTRFELLRPTGRSAHPGWAPRRDECPAGHTFSGLLGHNEVDAMNQILEFGDTDVDGASLAEVCRRYSVKELSLFGSSVRGEMRPESDIDIMVEFEPGVRVGLIKFEIPRRGVGSARWA